MKKYLFIITLGFSFFSFAMQKKPTNKTTQIPTTQQIRQERPTSQIYSFEAPEQGEFQTRMDLGLLTGTLKFSTEIQTQRIEGIDTYFSASYGLTDVLSIGARGSYLNSSSGGTVANTSRASASKAGLGDPEIFLTTRVNPGRMQLYLMMIAGIMASDFEVDNLRGSTTNSSGAYYVEPKFSTSITMGSFLLGGSASYRYHFNRQVSIISSSGTESLRLDPGNRIRASINSEVLTSYPFGFEIEYLLQDRYEAFSLSTPGGQKLTFGNTTILGASAYIRFLTDMGFGNFELVPWISYQTNVGKKRGTANVEDDQLMTFILKLQMMF
ncbi:MAG: hypothetical protein AABY64_00575 [Bdellovibrionota bacterium]